jgi:hypothetical protein
MRDEMHFAIRVKDKTTYIDAPSWFVAREHARTIPGATLEAAEPRRGEPVMPVRGAPTEQDTRDEIAALVRRQAIREALRVVRTMSRDQAIDELERRASL